MGGNREAEELVRLWQELQEAQVAGDARGLAELRVRADAESRRDGASEEWGLLAREAGRDAERLHGEVVAQPTAAVGDETVDTVTVDTVTFDTTANDTAAADSEPAPEPVEGGRRVNRKGSLIWLAFVIGWVVLQIVRSIGDGNGSP
ncbi:MAG: hypothetical protein H0T13_10060 [Actinobacteria bacterium]|nr:hypothetical protein [Actinomycetota bacterium]